MILQKQIGTGHSSEIFETADPTRAIKLFRPTAEFRPHLEQCEMEYTLGSRIRSPHVMQVIERGRSDLEGATRHYLVMERAPGRSLYDWVLDEFEAGEDGTASVLAPLDPLKFAVTLARGIRDVHSAHLLYGDVSNYNVVIDPALADASPKWVDFGSLSELESPSPFVTYSFGIFGHYSYGAPELVEYVEHRIAGAPAQKLKDLWRNVDVRSDIFALGMVFANVNAAFPQKSGRLAATIDRMTQHAMKRRPPTMDAVLHELSL